MQARTSIDETNRDRSGSESVTPPCLLCRSGRVSLFARANNRDYFGCEVCHLVFLAPAQRLERAAEREHYGTHENDPADPAYRAFLSRLAAPLVQRLPPAATGLDYGSGPAPVLAWMLEEQGFAMAHFDSFFARDRQALLRSYDFVTCSETAEHFFHPRHEFALLDCLLRPGGWLALMTEVLDEDQPFESWRYARDPTHACFYRPATFDWIARSFDWTPAFPHRNVVLFRKPA